MQLFPETIRDRSVETVGLVPKVHRPTHARDKPVSVLRALGKPPMHTGTGRQHMRMRPMRAKTRSVLRKTPNGHSDRK